MINASYFRSQAETCIRLSRTVTDERIAAELVEMAEDFTAKAAELDTKEQYFPLKKQNDHEDGTDLA